MRKIFCVLLSATVFLGADAFGGTPTTTGKTIKAKKCLFPKSRKRAPSWVCSAPADGSVMTAVGSAGKSGAGISFMEQMAAADARMQLARNLRGTGRKASAGSAVVAGGDKAESDSALTTRIADESLQGTKIMKKAWGPDGTLYVLVGIDARTAQKLQESIKSHVSSGAMRP